ncbi:unnamed protein product [Alternaria sp. RS040]
MRHMAAYILMYEDKLLPEEEDALFPQLRAQPRLLWAAFNAAYNVKLELLRDGINTDQQDGTNGRLHETQLQRPTGDLPLGLDNWFCSVSKGVKSAEDDFESVVREGYFDPR